MRLHIGRQTPLHLVTTSLLFFVFLTQVAAAQSQTPRPALVVLSKDANQLEIIDPASYKVVGKVPTGAVPHEVAVSTDGNIAVTTNYGAHQNGTTLTVIDLNSQKQLYTVELTNVVGPEGEKFGDLTGPHGVEFFQGKFYFTAEGNKKIARYDPAKNEIDWVLDIGQNRTHMLVISKRTHTIYTSNVNSDSVSAVQPSPNGGHWNSTVIPVGKGPEGIDISPDDKEVWAANSTDGSVSIVDTSSKKVTETISVGTKHSNRLKFTPDGKLVLISDLGSGDLLVLDASTRKTIKRLKLGTSTEGIMIPPDGSRAFVAVSGDNKVDVFDLKSLDVVTSFDSFQDPDGMAWRQ
jgi:YVTN family beta-propeller protein